MGLITSQHVEVHPFYQHFSVHDPVYDDTIDSAEATRKSVSEIAAGNGELAFIRCVQERVRVSVRVDLYDEEPPTDSASSHGWELAAVLTLRCATSEICVDQVMTGAVLTLRLPAPGPHVLIVRHRGRTEILEQLSAVETHTEGQSIDEQIEAREHLAGVEAYLLEVWPGPNPSNRSA
ncbi:hypothetical protein [Longispora urticae]